MASLGYRHTQIVSSLFKEKVYNTTFTTVQESGPDGADPQLLQTIADKFNFKFEFKVAAGFVDAINMVSKQDGVAGFNTTK